MTEIILAQPVGQHLPVAPVPCQGKEQTAFQHGENSPRVTRSGGGCCCCWAQRIPALPCLQRQAHIWSALRGCSGLLSPVGSIFLQTGPWKTHTQLGNGHMVRLT